jgi:hypothetical protein
VANNNEDQYIYYATEAERDRLLIEFLEFQCSAKFEGGNTMATRTGNKRHRTATKRPAWINEIMLAGERLGDDGQGRNGLVGYLYRIARTQPKLMGRLLIAAMRYEDAVQNPEPLDDKRTATKRPAWINEIILAGECVGDDGQGRNGLIGYFYRIARTQLNLMGRLLIAAMRYDDAVQNSEPVDDKTTEELRETLRKRGLPDQVLQ